MVYLCCRDASLLKIEFIALGTHAWEKGQRGLFLPASALARVTPPALGSDSSVALSSGEVTLV